MASKIFLLFFSLWILNEGVAKDPQAALQELIQGNQRHVKEELIHPNRFAERKEELSLKQAPFATIVGCADSRVTPEIIFDQGLGDLFTHLTQTGQKWLEPSMIELPFFKF